MFHLPLPLFLVQLLVPIGLFLANWPEINHYWVLRLGLLLALVGWLVLLRGYWLNWFG